MLRDGASLRRASRDLVDSVAAGAGYPYAAAIIDDYLGGALNRKTVEKSAIPRPQDCHAAVEKVCYPNVLTVEGCAPRTGSDWEGSLDFTIASEHCGDGAV